LSFFASLLAWLKICIWDRGGDTLLVDFDGLSPRTFGAFGADVLGSNLIVCATFTECPGVAAWAVDGEHDVGYDLRVDGV